MVDEPDEAEDVGVLVVGPVEAEPPAGGGEAELAAGVVGIVCDDVGWS